MNRESKCNMLMQMNILTYRNIINVKVTLPVCYLLTKPLIHFGEISYGDLRLRLLHEVVFIPKSPIIIIET